MDGNYLIVGTIISFLVLLVLIIVLVWRKARNQPAVETDYRALFCVGLCFLPAGIAVAVATRNPGLFGISGLGIVYIVIGLQNKDKWKTS